jgi:hypothetical protein
MGHYDELLQAANALGFGLQDAGSTHAAAAPSRRAADGAADSSDSIAQAQQLVEQCRLLHDLELRMAALAGHMGARDAADAAQLAARASATASTADTLRRISASKDALAYRLRSASTRPSVPVAPHCQPDFTAMLRCAAASAGPLHAGMLAVQWAAGLDARPSCWEDQLRPIREAAASIRETLGSMSDFDAALAQRRSVAEAAAAGAASVVGGGGSGGNS